MPIDLKEFKNMKTSNLEEEIISFLEERKEEGFTSLEIMLGTNYHPDFSTPEVAKMSTFAVADFTTLLHDLVRRGKVRMKIVRDRMYFTAGGLVRMCPKCGIEVVLPRKTWKMAGRPNNKGTRTELLIGLYDCPRHGVFRSVLGKRKI